MASKLYPNHRNTHKLTLPNLTQLAKDTLLVQRKSSKFDPSTFLLMLIQAVYSGNASFNSMASTLAHSLVAMARQSLWERFTTKSTAFLMTTLHNLMEQRLSPVRETLHDAGIDRIIVEDSTSLVLPKKNAKLFPAHGNAHGKTAGVKVDIAYDMKSGQCVNNSLEAATEQDKNIGKETLTIACKGDLFLRDMGYFIIKSFKELEELGAHWLSRLPMTCNLIDTEGNTLESLLRNAVGNSIDTEVFLGDEKHPCRLIAVRADSGLAEQRKRDRKEKARKKGKTPSKEKLIRDEWHLMVTSLDEKQASVNELCHLYGTRWSIELQFRGMKSSLNLRQALNRVTGEHHVFALVLAAMIAYVLYSKFWNIYHTILVNAGHILSLEKLFQNFMGYFAKRERLEEVVFYNPDYRHISYDKRNRSAKVNQGFTPLT